MNAHGAHYVANAGAKIQPFFGLTTTFPYFFGIYAYDNPEMTNRDTNKRHRQTDINNYFILFIYYREAVWYNFAVFVVTLRLESTLK
jgi:hypothetical protein